MWAECQWVDNSFRDLGLGWGCCLSWSINQSFEEIGSALLIIFSLLIFFFEEMVLALEEVIIHLRQLRWIWWILYTSALPIFMRFCVIIQQNRLISINQNWALYLQFFMHLLNLITISFWWWIKIWQHKIFDEILEHETKLLSAFNPSVCVLYAYSLHFLWYGSSFA